MDWNKKSNIAIFFGCVAAIVSAIVLLVVFWDKLLALCRNIDRINTDTLKEKTGLVKKKVKDLTDGGQSASGFWQSAKTFFRNAFGFVSRLFKKYA